MIFLLLYPSLSAKLRCLISWFYFLCNFNFKLSCTISYILFNLIKSFPPNSLNIYTIMKLNLLKNCCKCMFLLFFTVFKLARILRAITMVRGVTQDVEREVSLSVTVTRDAMKCDSQSFSWTRLLVSWYLLPLRQIKNTPYQTYFVRRKQTDTNVYWICYCFRKK